jgi:hypothetical protein
LYEKYKNLTPAQKIAYSTGFIALGLAGTALGATSLIVASVTGKVVLRGLTAAVTAKATERYIVNFNNSTWNKKISDEKAKNIGIAVGVGVFLLGSLPWKDIFEAIEHLFHADTGGTVTAPSPAVQASTPVQASAPALPASAVETVATHAPASTSSTVSILAETKPDLTLVTDYAIHSGDSLWGILSEENVMHTLFGDDISVLSDDAKKSLVQNIINSLSPEELAKVGVKAGNEYRIFAGDSLHINKLAEIIKEKTLVSSDGGRSSLLEWAKNRG